MDELTIDGLEENEFRRSIENMLRHGQADDAANKLRSLLAPFAGEGKILPARFLEVTPEEIVLTGWDALAARLGEYDRPNHQISALGIVITDPDAANVNPDEIGKLTPFIETSYFSDDAYPFTEAGRTDLLEGYSFYGCQWQGDCEKTDTTLSVEGIDDLYGAIARLEASLLSSKEPGQDEICAGSLGACYLAVLIHQAVRDTIRRNGLPRPLCVMTGYNGVYPFFDAPVMSSEECLGGGIVEAVPEGLPPITYDVDAEDEDGEAEESEAPEDSAGVASLLSIVSSKGKKKPVILLDAEEAEISARRFELVAAQDMADAGMPDRHAVLASQLEPVAEAQAYAIPGLGEPPADFDDYEAGQDSEPFYADGPVPVDDGHVDHEPVGTGWHEAEPEYRVTAFDSEIPLASAAAPAWEEDIAFNAPAVPVEVETAEPEPPVQPLARPISGNSFRATIVQTAHETAAATPGGFAALLRRFMDWLLRR